MVNQKYDRDYQRSQDNPEGHIQPPAIMKTQTKICQSSFIQKPPGNINTQDSRRQHPQRKSDAVGIGNSAFRKRIRQNSIQNGKNND